MSDRGVASSALRRMIAATKVALVGASERSTWSHLIIRRFRDFGHQGQLYAVNRDAREAHGLPGYRSCRDIPSQVDTAIIFVPAQAVAGALEDVADAGITSAVVPSSGFAETGVGPSSAGRRAGRYSGMALGLLSPHSPEAKCANLAPLAPCPGPGPGPGPGKSELHFQLDNFHLGKSEYHDFSRLWWAVTGSNR